MYDLTERVLNRRTSVSFCHYMRSTPLVGLHQLKKRNATKKYGQPTTVCASETL